MPLQGCNMRASLYLITFLEDKQRKTIKTLLLPQYLFHCKIEAEHQGDIL